MLCGKCDESTNVHMISIQHNARVDGYLLIFFTAAFNATSASYRRDWCVSSSPWFYVHNLCTGLQPHSFYREEGGERTRCVCVYSVIDTQYFNLYFWNDKLAKDETDLDMAKGSATQSLPYVDKTLLVWKLYIAGAPMRLGMIPYVSTSSKHRLMKNTQIRSE